MQDLNRYFGNYGLYQLYQFLLNLCPEFMSACQLLAFTWTGFAPDTRCRIPSLDGNGTDYDKLSRQMNNWYAPPNEPGQYCQMCTTNLSHCTSSLAHDCTSGLIFDPKSALIHNSLVIEFDMACDTAWKRQFIFSLPTIGVMIGLSFWGPLGDKYGRRPIILGTAVGIIIVAFVSPLASNFYAYALLQVAMGVFECGVATTCYILFMEMVDGRARTLGGIWIQGLFTVGLFYLCMTAYLVRDWRYVQLLAAIPCVFLIPYYWICPESTRWLIIKGKLKEAEEAIRKAAKMNGIYIPDQVIKNEMNKARLAHESETKKRSTVLDLFKHPTLAIRTLIIFFNWLAVSMGYYGLTQNTQDLPGSPYMTFALSALSEFPGFIICVPIMERLGRKAALVTTMGLGGVACILSGLIGQSLAVLIMAMVGKMFVAAAFAVVYNYSAEIFPTVVRQSAFGYASVCARIGSILAPQIRLLGNYFGDFLPIVIYGSVSALAACLDLFLPETRNTQMPETIDDAIHFPHPKFSPRDSTIQPWTVSENSEISYVPQESVTYGSLASHE